MEDTPAYWPLYINDWLGSPHVAELQAARLDGVYVSILVLQMQRGRLPTDIQKLAALVKRPLEDVAACWRIVGQMFQVDADGAFHPKTEKARRRTLCLSAKNRAKAEKRWSKNAGAYAAADAGAYATQAQDEPTRARTREGAARVGRAVPAWEPPTQRKPLTPEERAEVDAAIRQATAEVAALRRARA